MTSCYFALRVLEVILLGFFWLDRNGLWFTSGLGLHFTHVCADCHFMLEMISCTLRISAN